MIIGYNSNLVGVESGYGIEDFPCLGVVRISADSLNEPGDLVGL